MKAIFHGITVAAASGLLLGAAFKPDITFDQAVLGPQILHAAGASAPATPQPVKMASLAPS